MYYPHKVKKRKNTYTCYSVPDSQKELRLWSVPIAPNINSVNIPIGMDLANDIATKYNLINNTFTRAEFYRFLYGNSPNWKFKVPRKKVIRDTVNCVFNLTNTKDGFNNVIQLISPFINYKSNIPPLASYGLKFTSSGNILTDCTTGQPCLTFNKYILGPLQQICKDSGCLKKFLTMLKNPIFIESSIISMDCQALAEGPCMWNDPKDNQTYGVPISYPLWIVNFAFIYTLCPEIAAYMPKYRYRIPSQVVNALEQNVPNGIPWKEYKQYF